MTWGCSPPRCTGLQAQLAADEERMRKLAAGERALEAQRGEAARRGVKMGGVFASQLGSARSLAEIQQRFVNEQLQQAAAAPASRHSAHQLIDETNGFVRAALAAALEEVRALEAASTTHSAALVAAAAAAAQELRRLHAERQAVAVANGERQRFFEEKSRQLEAEARDAAAAGGPLEGRGSCMQMVQVALAAAQQSARELSAAAAAAEDARKRRAAEARRLTGENEGRVGALRVQIDSEASVALQQHKYVGLLGGRLGEDSLISFSETDEDCKVCERGVALVRASRTAMAARAGGMAAALERCDAERQAAEEALRDAESAAAAEDATLKESLVATRDGVAQLRTYEAGLLKLLAGGGDLLAMTVDGGSAPPTPSGDVPGLMVSLMSSADLASKTIEQNISAARAVRVSARQRRESEGGTPRGERESRSKSLESESL